MWNKNSRKETAKCPVCRTVLGAYDPDTIFKAHCGECRATFFFKPDTKKPSVIMDSHKQFKGYCGPAGCKCRD